MSFQLDLLREILGITEEDAAYEIASEVTPLYEATALSALNSLLSGISTADDVWDEIEERRKELLLPEASSRELLSSVVMQALGAPLEKTNKFARVNNDAAVYENVLEALAAKEALIGILAKSGWDKLDDFYDIFCNPWEDESANGFLNSEDRIKIYKIFVNRSALKSGGEKIEDETFDQMKETQGLLAIPDSQVKIETHAAFGPELQKTCMIACDEIVQDYTRGHCHRKTPCSSTPSSRRAMS